MADMHIVKFTKGSANIFHYICNGLSSMEETIYVFDYIIWVPL